MTIPNQFKNSKPGDVHHKLLPFSNVQVKADDTGDKDVAGEISGYAAGLLNIDRGSDIIFPGAFDDDLEDFKENGVVAYQHDYTAVIGKPLEVEERLEPDYGLFARAKIINTTLGADVMKLVKQQVLKTLSIGYRLKEGGYSVMNRETLVSTLQNRLIKQSKIDEVMQDFDKRKLQEVFGLFKIKLFEYSVVTLPMNANAVITGAKAEEFGNLLDGLPFAYSPLFLLAGVKGYAERLAEQSKDYSGKNRNISITHREGIVELRKALEDLLPRIKEVEGLALAEKASPDDVQKVLLEVMKTEAIANGVEFN